MKVLITGGNGFIGSATARQFADEGFDVTIFDRWSLRLKLETPYSLWLGDVRDLTTVREAVASHDMVIHCAGVLGTQETIDEPRPAIETNINGSLNVFTACRDYDVPCVYITVGNYWMNNSYSISKTTAERFAWMFNREHGTHISVVRAMNAYGPGQKAYPVRKIMPTFIGATLRGEAIEVYGDGSQVMDMIHVRDVAGVLFAAATVDPQRGCSYDPVQDDHKSPAFEAGTGRFTTVQEIAQLVIDCVGHGSIENVPMRPGEPEQSIVIADPRTLIPLFGGEPPMISLEDGIEETVKFYREQMSAL